MTDDDVIRGVRAAREAILAAHGYDLRAMLTAMRARDAVGDRVVVRLPPRPAAGQDASAAGGRPAVAPAAT